MMLMTLIVGTLVTCVRSLELYQMEYQDTGQCGENETYNSVSLSCQACGPGTRLSNVTGECGCLEGWVIVSSGNTIQCQQCPLGQQATLGRIF